MYTLRKFFLIHYESEVSVSDKLMQVKHLRIRIPLFSLQRKSLKLLRGRPPLPVNKVARIPLINISKGPKRWLILPLKVSSRVKNHHFSKFAIFRRLNRAHQELSFKKNSRKKMFFLCRLMERKSFFYANYFNCSLTSPVILDTRAAVEPS